MKSIILAAGTGTRMGKYTRDLPKGMLNFCGSSLIQRQIAILRRVGINNIVIATGYKNEAIRYDGVKYYHNPDFASTNMVETLFCARNEFDDDVIVSYSDILFTESLVRSVCETSGDIVVAVDSAWRDYWKMRYDSTEHDLETLTVGHGRITELGREVASSEGIDFRYIGVIKFSSGSWGTVMDLYDKKKSGNEKWIASGKIFQQGYMTDLLNELINRGVEVVPCVSAKQWLEFDTEQDYEITIKSLKKGELDRVSDIALLVNNRGLV